jgi:hypothetical protein
MLLIILSKNIFYAVVILGVILGPIYSITIYYQYSSTSLAYNNEYYESSNHNELLYENKSFFGVPNLYSFSIFNYSIYSILLPSQNITGYQFQNFANNDSFELLELNVSSDFKSISSSQTFFLNNFLIENLNREYSFTRPIFDGSSFWVITNPDYQYPKNPISFISFKKDGTILSNHSINVFDNSTSLKHPSLRFLGIYDKYFFVSDYKQNNLLIFSKLNFTLLFTQSVSKVIDDQHFSNFYLGSYGNIDPNGYLWLYIGSKSDSTIDGVALSPSEIIKFQSSKVKKVLSLHGSSGSKFSSDWTYNNVNVDAEFQSSKFIAYDKLISIQFGHGQSQSPYFYYSILEGVILTDINKIQISPLDVFLIFFGFLLLVSEAVIYGYGRFRTEKFNLFK